LRAGDSFAIEAELNRPASLHVVWVDADGKASWAYPRRRWYKPPEGKAPLRALRRPQRLDRDYEIPAGTPGMETVVLWAHDEPLPAGLDLLAEFAGLPPQRRQGKDTKVWFENGQVDYSDPVKRGPTWDDKVAGDPLRVLQERMRLLQERHGGYVRAVSFANLGR
jgi:hypothetical protein